MSFVSYPANRGFAVNSWLVETRTGLVVVDTQFTVSEAEKLARAVRQSGRATQRHHRHPSAPRSLQRNLPPAAARTGSSLCHAGHDRWIRATAEAKRAQWKPTYGADYPNATCVPDHPLDQAASWTVDGVRFESRDFGPGESLTESIVLARAAHAAFVGDLVYNRVHPWLAEGRSAQWLAQLERLRKSVPNNWTVYPGHGPASGVGVIDSQRDYIDDFRARTKAKLGPGGLTAAAASALVEDTRTRYPNWQLELLIPINAAAIAKEFAAPGSN